MATVTQTIPNYTGGISEQPDQLKVPGQVKSIQNAIPDIVRGLYKRPGSKRIGTAPLTNVQSNGSWFHYYRDETEGSYIGQVASDGKVRIWSCNDGSEKNVWYHTDNSAYSGGNSDHTSITSYLTPSSASATEEIQALTINDTTFLNNRSKTVATTGTTDARPHKNFAYVELLRTENGRQYSLNIYDSSSTTTINVATKIKIESDTLDEGNGSGTCPGIGTQVFSCDTAKETIIPTSAISSNVITVSSHGWSDGDYVRYHDEGGLVPTNLGDKQRYYIVNATTNTFQLSATSGGTALAIGTGTGNNNQFITGNTGSCLWIKNAAGTRYTGVGTKENLIFRISALGQQGKSGSGTGTSDYQCSYNREITLLHGGEGFIEGDKITVELDQAKTTYEYTIEITDIESAPIKANVKAVRPSPTPFDADTAVTVDAILGGIAGELTGVTVNSNPLLYQIIGNGIYLYTAADADDFNVEVVDQDLMRVMQTETNDVTGLPIQCKHGSIIKIGNTRMSDEDDYFVKFKGENDKDGPGQWIECPEPGIVKSFNAATMPHILQRQADGDFLVKQYTYADREVGDNVTNPIPSFVGQKINKVLFFRNRLVFLSGENVVTSRPGSIATPNFWSDTALTVSAIDPIDISCASTYPSDLFDGIEINTGLLCFSSNAQFLLASDDTIMNPDTAKLRAISWFNYNKVMPPISLGQTVGYIDNSNKYSFFMEIANVTREGEPIVINTSEIVPTLLPKDLDLLTNSKENDLIFFGKTNSDTVQGYRYLRTGEKQIQTSWFKWKFNNPLKYHFIINDVYYLLDTDNFLQSVNLVQADTDLSITQDSVEYLIHLDNYTTVSGGVYDAATNKTTFTNQSTWIPSVTSPNGKLVLVDTDSATARVGRYAECTILSGGGNDDFTVPGDWSSSTLNIGYLYDYQVDFPRVYLQKVEGENVQSDVNSKLTVHRIKLNFGRIGLYETTLTRVGKTDYTEVYESTILDEYDVSDAPYLAEKIKSIPVYERNRNVDITLKSAHPAPATLRSMSWEGDWSPVNYRRV